MHKPVNCMCIKALNDISHLSYEMRFIRNLAARVPYSIPVAFHAQTFKHATPTPRRAEKKAELPVARRSSSSSASCAATACWLSSNAICFMHVTCAGAPHFAVAVAMRTHACKRACDTTARSIGAAARRGANRGQVSQVSACSARQ